MILRGKYNGAKLGTEAMGWGLRKQTLAVGERSVDGEGRLKRRLELTEVRMQA